MTGRVALLRGVNVGGNKVVPAPALKALAEGLGLEAPRTVINSGNLVFRSARPPGELEPAIGAAMEAQLGVSCGVFVLTDADWAELIAANPFPDAAERDASQLLALVLRGPADPAQIEALRATAAPGERLQARGRVLYCDFVGGMGTSKMGSRATRLDGTGRNWNTVLKIDALLRP